MTSDDLIVSDDRQLADSMWTCGVLWTPGSTYLHRPQLYQAASSLTLAQSIFIKQPVHCPGLFPNPSSGPFFLDPPQELIFKISISSRTTRLNERDSRSRLEPQDMKKKISILSRKTRFSS